MAKRYFLKTIAKVLLLIPFLGFLPTIVAQPLGNEWINYNQSYYKFPVVQNGVYRLTHAQLLAAGVPLSNINNPRNFQVFGRGEEVALYVHNESSGVFSSTDYIEFYGMNNDGWLDARLYESPDNVGNKYYSLFTDTAYYYLTWNSLINNKRVSLQTATNYADFTESPYFWYDSKSVFSNMYLDGRKDYSAGLYINSPIYDAGEGWTAWAITLGSSATYNVKTKNAYTLGPLATAYFEFSSGSGSGSTSIFDHHTRIQVAGNTYDTLYIGYKTIKFAESLIPANLNANNTTITYSSINDLGSAADRFAVPFVRIVYPHTPNLEGLSEFSMKIDNASPQTKTYLNLTNFNGGNNPVFYDIDNNQKVVVTKNGSNYQVLISNQSGSKNCYITSESSIKTPSWINPVSANAKFIKLSQLNPSADYIIISHASLMVTNPNYSNVKDYKDYRNSVGYNVLLIDVETLYDQYSYGVKKHPLSVRNFIHELGNVYGYQQFKGLFIIGKAYRSSHFRKDNSLWLNTLVPTYGEPPSDIYMISGLVDTLYTPAIPIGRLAARTLDHVDLYLDKIKLHETHPSQSYDLWRKQVLHFSGGSTASEQNNISDYLANYERIIEDTLMGGTVSTFFKTTSDPIQINLSTLIKEYVNNGVGLMTFYGHAAGIGFDISIDNPSEYDNYGKYPLLLANSCYAGDIFQNTGTWMVNSAEEFVLIRDKGMIGYIASVSEANISDLNVYSSDFYKGLAYKSYGEGVGTIMKNVVQNFQNVNSPTRRDLVLSMTLHGDPAIKLFDAPKPDYEITQQSIQFNPEIVTSAVDSFEMLIAIKNLGKAINDSLLVQMVRRYESIDSVDRYNFLVKAPYYSDTLRVKMPVIRSYGIGTNTIDILLDGFNSIQEFNETNNSISISFIIKAADLSPVYPAEFSIVGESNIKLKASTYYPFTPLLKYIFEIDTNYYFNSPFKQSTIIQSVGGVIEWQLPFNLQDGTVYYWRVSLDSSASKSFNWRQSSFQYMNGQKGWSQAHFYQFKNNGYQLTKFDEINRTYKYVNDLQTIVGQTGIYPNVPWTEIYLRMNNSILGAWSCIPPDKGGIKFYVFNPVSAQLTWSDGNGWGISQYNNLHCYGYDYPAIEFPTVTTNLTAQGLGIITADTWHQRIVDFIAQIPNGYKVMAMSFGNPNTHGWPEFLYKSIDSIGSNYIRTIPNNIPYIIYGTKGELHNANELVASTTSEMVILNDSIVTNWKEGKITSPIIGPSKKWNSLRWSQHSLDAVNTDTVSLQLIGIKSDGSEHVVIDYIPSDSLEITQLNDLMNADVYPYCRLVCNMRDNTNRTPSYLDYWQLLYQPVGEFAIDPQTHFSFYADTLERGDTLSVSLAYKNISDVEMDSLLVRSQIKDQTGMVLFQKDYRLKPLAASEYVIDSIKFATTSLRGRNYLNFEINSINLETGVYDQLELSHINNKGDLGFYVKQDKENPLLDVTFDGVYIMDEDIVSARPEILIRLKDENKFIAINDTSNFKVYIKKRSELNYSVVYFQSIADELEFIPAALPDNSAVVIYRPKLADDIYDLQILATDGTLNPSSDNGYRIRFEVINKSTITYLLNWPNPFSDKTHFVFTLTGSQLPDYMKIQIMTVTGKVVREIDMSELGSLHIGRNITDYAWDGKDQYGDQLANGVYLYRVITQINGESIELRSTSADQYFKKEFGKMYLMR